MSALSLSGVIVGFSLFKVPLYFLNTCFVCLGLKKQTNQKTPINKKKKNTAGGHRAEATFTVGFVRASVYKVMREAEGIFHSTFSTCFHRQAKSSLSRSCLSL